jgi:phage terminase large subunit-like protein
MTLSTISSPVSAVPRFATARNPQLATYGPQVDQVASVLGHPSMPWQAQVGSVANEIIPDPETGTWAFRYPTVVCTTPRQAGKTTLLESVLAHRCIALPDFRAFYTAQSGQDARDVWYEWQANLSQKMPNRWKFRLSNGEESAKYPPQASFIRTFPPTPDALHGKQTDFVALDEVWKYSLEQGGAITQATVPTQATRPRRQLWIVSTAGRDDSLWMRSWIERARASLDDPESRIAYFEWSTPEDVPITGPLDVAPYHPAIGHTITEAALRDAWEQMNPDEYARAFGNRWPVADRSWQSSWSLLPTGTPIPADAYVHIAADSSWNHHDSSITAAAAVGDQVIVEVIDSRTGVDWMLPRLVHLASAHRCSIIVQKNGPLGYLCEDLTRAGVRVVEATSSDYADAIARFQTMVVAGLITHQKDPRLDAAVLNVKSSTADRPTWRRRIAAVDISPLVAATFAVWKAATPPATPIIITR